MKLNKVLPMLAVATFALAACAPKVDYKKFHEKAEAAAKKAKDASFSKVVVNGSVKYGSMSYEFKDVSVKFESNKFVAGLDANEVMVAEFLNGNRAENILEDKETTYYAGSTFKVEANSKEGKGKMEWNKYGLMTLIDVKAEDESYVAKVTAKYSK